MSFELHPLRSAGRGLLAAVLGLALVVPSSHASGDDLWRECRDGNVTTNHSQADFQDALENPPADGAEYSDCEDQIRSAQIRAARGGEGGGGTPGGGTPSGGPSAPAVEPEDLSSALSASGVDPSAPPAVASDGPAPDPVVIDGETIDLEDGRLPSIVGALSLPLPLAASAVVVLVSAALPVARYLVGRFGGPPTGTTPSS